MERKWKKILTVIIMLMTVGIIIGFSVSSVMFKTGDINRDEFLSMCYFLSMTLVMLVIVYGAIMMTDRSAKEQYLEYLDEKKKE